MDGSTEQVQLQEDIDRIQDELQGFDDYDSDSDGSEWVIDLAEDPGDSSDEDDSTRSTFRGESLHTHLESENSSHADAGVDEFEVAQLAVPGLLYSMDGIEGSELPLTMETCLALNRAYQEILLENLRKIHLALAENREKQNCLEAELEGRTGQSSSTTSSTVKKRSLRSYSFPFFKDTDGRFPPANEDVRIKEKMKEQKQDILPEKSWNVSHRSKLVEAVRADALAKLLQPLMNRRELEEEKLEACDQDEEKEPILARIAKIDEEIALKNSKPHNEVLAKVDEEKVDWLKISNIEFGGMRSWQSCKMMWRTVLNPKINRRKWSQQEESQLEEFAAKYKKKNWVKIAEELGTGRTAFQCLQYYQVHLNRELSKRKWSKEEDTKLKELVKSFKIGCNKLPWRKISYYMEGRNPQQCLSRWTQIDPDLRRGNWNEADDSVLMAAVGLVGTGNWVRVKDFVPHRSASQCRERWHNCLNPSLRLSEWTYEEDKQLLIMIKKHGPGNWSKIASEMPPGRTDNMVLQRFKRLQNWERKTKWFEEQPEDMKKALLGRNLPKETFAEWEKTNWNRFKVEIGVYQEDYEKQKRDKENGDLVVPRPPCVLGYSSRATVYIWKRRMKLQKLINHQIQKLTSGDVDPKNLVQTAVTAAEFGLSRLYKNAEKANSLISSLQQKDPCHVSVRELLDVSRKNLENPPPRPRSKKSKVSKAMIRIEQDLRITVQKKLSMSRKIKKGRPRKFFCNKPNHPLQDIDLTDEEARQLSVSTLSLMSKALNVDTVKLLKNASKAKKGTPDNLAPLHKKAKMVLEVEMPVDPVHEMDITESIDSSFQDCTDGLFVSASMETDNGSVKTDCHDGSGEKVIVSGNIANRINVTQNHLRKDTSNEDSVSHMVDKGISTKEGPDTAPYMNTSSKCCQDSFDSDSETNMIDKEMRSQLLNCSKQLSLNRQGTWQRNSADGGSKYPFLPPNSTTISGFRTLLLERRKMVRKAGSSYIPSLYATIKSGKKSKSRDENLSAWNKSHGTPDCGETLDRQDSKDIIDMELSMLDCCEDKNAQTGPVVGTPLADIKKTAEYQTLKARFQSIFIWPALMSSIYPAFNRKDFTEKAPLQSQLLAPSGDPGEGSSSHPTEDTTKPKRKKARYACTRSKRFYKNVVVRREIKQSRSEAHKKNWSARKLGLSASDVSVKTPSNVNERSGAAKDTSDTTTETIASQVEHSGIPSVEVGDQVPTATPTNSGLKRKGRPVGTKNSVKWKLADKIVKRPARNVKKTENFQITHKGSRRQSEVLPPKHRKNKRLTQEINRLMQQSVKAMEQGDEPDPAKGLSNQKQGKGIILQKSSEPQVASLKSPLQPPAAPAPASATVTASAGTAGLAATIPSTLQTVKLPGSGERVVVLGNLTSTDPQSHQNLQGLVPMMLSTSTDEQGNPISVLQPVTLSQK